MTVPTWARRLTTASVVGWFVRRELAVIVIEPPEDDGVVIDARDRFGRPGRARRQTVVNEEWRERRVGTWG